MRKMGLVMILILLALAVGSVDYTREDFFETETFGYTDTSHVMYRIES